MNTRIIVYSLFLSLSITFISFAQKGTDGIYAPGATVSITRALTKPICWVNEAKEFNVYIPGQTKVLLTLQNEEDEILKKLPKFVSVTYTRYSFVLTSNKGDKYYFAAPGYEEKQMLQLLNPRKEIFKKRIYGHDLLQHLITNDIDIKKLKSARSVYDVLEK